MKRTAIAAFGLCLVVLGSSAQTQPVDPLNRARRAYNSRQFEAAIAAAKEAQSTPATANSASVVLARAYLDKFRASYDAEDMDAARVALGAVKPDLLPARDRVEFLVALGVAMFVDGCAQGCFSAAAEFFDLALAAAAPVDPALREPIFEWWATALDHHAQYAVEDNERRSTYRRLLERADAERARDQDSASAAYWTAAAARGAGDYDRAWGAAIAGWVRARYLGARGETLRADLNRLVMQILLPERAKATTPDEDPGPALENLRKQWTEITGRYK
jgi:hypothetical protein